MLAGGALLAATVDADEVLQRFRCISAHSALTAALAVRLVPVLAAKRGAWPMRAAAGPAPRRARDRPSADRRCVER